MFSDWTACIAPKVIPILLPQGFCRVLEMLISVRNVLIYEGNLIFFPMLFDESVSWLVVGMNPSKTYLARQYLEFPLVSWDSLFWISLRIIFTCNWKINVVYTVNVFLGDWSSDCVHPSFFTTTQYLKFVRSTEMMCFICLPQKILTLDWKNRRIFLASLLKRAFLQICFQHVGRLPALIQLLVFKGCTC